MRVARLAVVAAAGAVLLLAAFLILSRCAPQPNPEAPDNDPAPSAVSDNNDVSPDPEPDRETLVELLGQEEADQLLTQAENNGDARWIASHLDEYDFEGPEVKYKILKLAADEPASLAYVRDFPELFPAEDQTDDPALAMAAGSPSPTVPDTAVPHLYQWDRRWGQTVYCSTAFGLTGCGPTSLAMIYQGLSGDESLTPYDLGILAQEQGYMMQFDGTADGFFTQTAAGLGLCCESQVPTAQAITEALSLGHPIITNLAPGYFTRYGHFFVLAGLTDDGKVIVNDPYSVVRSGQLWDAEFIASESRQMYVYSL